MYSYQPFVNVKLLWKINLKIQLEFTVLVFNDNENWCINRFTEAICLSAVFDVLYWRCNFPMKFKHNTHSSSQ